MIGLFLVMYSVMWSFCRSSRCFVRHFIGVLSSAVVLCDKGIDVWCGFRSGVSFVLFGSVCYGLFDRF